MLLTEPSVACAEDTRLRILVLCTGNSARSIMAEALFNSVGAALFSAYSAGSKPTGRVNPLALEHIQQLDYPAAMEMRSKSWTEFTGPGAPEFDLLLTVCANARAEAWPTFSGRYVHMHWGFADPAGCSDDSEQEREAFRRCFNELKQRVENLVSALATDVDKAAAIQAMRTYE